MRPVSRRPVRKSRSASAFRHQVARVKGANINTPMRGGYRF